MSACPSKAELEEVALGSGRPEPRAHAASCPDCAARLAWLRKEEEIVSRWAAQDGAPTGHLWDGVRRRIAGQRRRRRTAAAGFAAAIAASFLVLLRPSAELPQTTASAAAAIDEAEAEYGRAIESLEAQVAARHGGAQGQGGAIAQGRAENPPDRNGELSKAGKLVERFATHRDMILRFVIDLAVPFTNNSAERALRPVKLQQKTSATWRILQGLAPAAARSPVGGSTANGMACGPLMVFLLGCISNHACDSDMVVLSSSPVRKRYDSVDDQV